MSETDPDKGILITEDDLSKKIFEHFPWSKKLIKSHLKQRLEILRRKDTVKGRQVRWYKKERSYCLPFETRESLKSENQSDEVLNIDFFDELKRMASDLFDADDGEYSSVADLCCRTIHKVFEKQGLLFSHFLTSSDEKNVPVVVSDCIAESLDDISVSGSIRVKYSEYAEGIIRNVFYHGSPTQRAYLESLSRSYVLLFTLQAEPKIIEYFSNMSASFNLYLGSDILVQALSERYVEEENQVARNLLKMAHHAGILMYLTESVLEEIYTHIRGTYYEFSNHFEHVEQYMTREIVSNSDKILIRSYFYAKEEKKVSTWPKYLGQFVSYNNVTKERGRDELCKYLLAEFDLTFMENSELETCVNKDDARKLAKRMLKKDDKKNKYLAESTSLLVHGIYGLRRKNKETRSNSEFGLKTWWMTNQTRVLNHTSDIVKKNGASYLMRPEFLLNFIAMAPDCSDARDSFRNIFPSVFGIQLGHRLDPDVFENVMAQIGDWKDLEKGRIVAKVAALSDELKADRFKRYEQKLKPVSESTI